MGRSSYNPSNKPPPPPPSAKPKDNPMQKYVKGLDSYKSPPMSDKNKQYFQDRINQMKGGCRKNH